MLSQDSSLPVWFPSATRALGVLGLLLSVYALYVEYRVATQIPGQDRFKALCDFGEGAECSRVLTSESSHLLLGIPNAALGTIFYTLISLYPDFVRIQFPHHQYFFLAASTASCFLSLYLASELIRLRDLCILCISLYIINAAIFTIAIQTVNKYSVMKQRKSA